MGGKFSIKHGNVDGELSIITKDGRAKIMVPGDKISALINWATLTDAVCRAYGFTPKMVEGALELVAAERQKEDDEP